MGGSVAPANARHNRAVAAVRAPACGAFAPIPLGGAAEALYDELNQRGYGNKDFSFILEMLRGRT